MRSPLYVGRIVVDVERREARTPVPSTILICDDDSDVRSAMRRTLRGYEIAEAANPREALDVLKTRRFDAIVSDYSMGTDRDGLDLLNHIRLLYPDMVRFLVTANHDVEIVVRAVNEGAVDRYFLKPWSDSKLRAALAIVLASRHPGTLE
jgi:DNA-binding NtrC family response regulator